MAFEVTLYIQGVGNYVPHVDDDRLLVLFPDQGTETNPRFRSPLPPHEPICLHRPGVQFRATALAPGMPDVWLTLNAEKRWIGVTTDATPAMRLDGGAVDGLLRLGDVLSTAGLPADDRIDPAALPGPEFDHSLVSAGLFLRQGVLEADPDRTSAVQIPTPQASVDRQASNTMRVRMGEVESCTLHLAPLVGGATESVELAAPDQGLLEIWIRHSCDLGRIPVSDPEYQLPESEDEREDALQDQDFVVNYGLLASYGELLGATDGGKGLPVPRARPSFLGGLPIDPPEHKCQPGGSPAASYDSLFV